MKRYQPLILQKLNVQVPGIKIHQLALHRHLPETTSVRPHAHRFGQCLLYLTGQGTQQIQSHAHPIRAGTAVYLPPGTEHAFFREANRRPICLVINFNWRTGAGKPAKVKPLPLSMVLEARQQISAISHLQRRPNTGSLQETGARSLELLALLLSGMELARYQRSGESSPILRRMEKLLAVPETWNLRLGDLARRAGYQRDYLNRLLKAHTGLTLGQYRSRKLAEQAQQLLRQKSQVGNVAAALGFNDPNYFSRWFRKQIGESPVRWRRIEYSGT
jgi:AraC-like DNA-binding protein